MRKGEQGITRICGVFAPLRETALIPAMIKISVFLICVLLAASLQTPSVDRIKIGAFLPLTGATAGYGISSLNGIKLATDEVNRNGGIDGKQVELIVEDDHSNTDEVPGLVNKLIKEDKVDALIAEPISVRAMVAAPIAQENGVVMISSASVKPELTKQGDYIFRACFISSTEGEAIAKFATGKLNAKTAAIILDSKNDYAVVLAGFFIESFTKFGGRIVTQQTYAATDTDITAQINAIGAASPDVVFAPGFYTTAPLVARTVKQSKLKSILIGSDGWDSPDLMKDGSKAFEGVYFANHFWFGATNRIVKMFVANYMTKYRVAPDAGAATAYDAARMLFDAFRRAKSVERSAVRDALAQTKDFEGVTGNITLDANRDAQVPVYMLRIEKNGKFSFHQ